MKHSFAFGEPSQLCQWQFGEIEDGVSRLGFEKLKEERETELKWLQSRIKES